MHSNRDPSLYRDMRTARFVANDRVKEFQSFEKQAKKRLLILLLLSTVRIWRSCQATILRLCPAKEKVNLAFASILNGGFVLSGPKLMINP